MNYPVVVLKKGRDYSVRRFHPWIFSGAVHKGLDSLVDGDLVQVQSESREVLGVAHFAAGGSIALKMLAFSPTFIDESFFVERLRSAKKYRESLGLPRKGVTTAYRLVHGEGDLLPGLIVDVYNDVCVLQAHSAGMHRAKPLLVEALQKVFSNQLAAIVDKSTSSGQDKSGERVDTGSYLFGEGGDSLVFEDGLQYHIDWIHGQKTGFFLDQRENRYLLRDLCQGKRVLNAFCYSGGFSLSALKGGAKSVVSLDSSEKALEILERNLQTNRSSGALPADAEHRSVCEDFLRYMQNLTEDFDVVLLDPPAFAKHRKALESGLRGYRSINTAGLRGVRPGGFLLTFSCSQLVSRNDFRDLLLDSSAKANKQVRVVRELHQAPCHPVNMFHPEGEYLKGFVLQVQ